MRSDKSLALIMAAGYSRRFGSDKRLAQLADGRTLLATTLSAAMDAFEQVRVVVNTQVVPTDLGIPEAMALVIRPVAPVGLGGSIAHAVRALHIEQLPRNIDSIAICLGDMPWVKPETYGLLAARATANTILRPVYSNIPGHPVFFGRSFWPALADNLDDQGARSVLAQFLDKFVAEPVADPGVVYDIDYPSAIRELNRTCR
ncbi:nucleotidyltransferase family protein [Billgrantia diversa]|uniref:nucleotidyltransferase family protein n=1 Tax=Halomonas sp. MCCC 1A13316 TaxID=2733487 RepID=UPI0018A5A5FD|nr:nucleotidyltransferase family protein [Halomonas sp. MCCC 1A13316]QOR37960.1 nucleotidyltransferase family protein [Halomonas sp. MCCC 1A13316]